MDMTQLWQQAKNTVLKEGEHLPMIYVETRGGEMYLVAVMIEAETTNEKHRALFSAGRKVGIENKGKEPVFLCFVTEAWVSKLKPGEKRKYAPSQDPNRSEVLIAQTMDLAEKPVRQMIYMAEMVRDDSGKLVDLKTDVEPQEAEYTLLPPFLAGWLSAEYSNEEIIESMGAAIRRESLQGLANQLKRKGGWRR